MSAVFPIVCVALACVAAGATGVCVALCVGERSEQKARRTKMFALANVQQSPDTARPQMSFALSYAARLTREIASGRSVVPFLSAWVAGLQRGRFGARFKQRVAWAGCVHEVSALGFCEASLRFMIAGGLGGLLLGSLFSTVFGVVLGLIGAVLGATLPSSALMRAIKARTTKAELHLSEMLQVVALGLRSGLSFDRSFELYGLYFDNDFAHSCTRAYRSWALGLKTREEALHEFARSYDCEQLSRIVDSIMRSLRFGSPLVPALEEASAQSQATYRARLEERVAKAPVKMMFPTGVLILPAMLLLVLGPVLLELAQNF